MTTISAKSDVMTLINVFTVEPASQRRLVELLPEATEVSVRRAPGFVSASLHRSTDGTKVTMYAQWRSIDDYQAMRQDSAPLTFLQDALTIAKPENSGCRSRRSTGRRPIGHRDPSRVCPNASPSLLVSRRGPSTGYAA